MLPPPVISSVTVCPTVSPLPLELIVIALPSSLFALVVAKLAELSTVTLRATLLPSTVVSTMLLSPVTVNAIVLPSASAVPPIANV